MARQGAAILARVIACAHLRRQAVRCRSTAPSPPREGVAGELLTPRTQLIDRHSKQVMAFVLGITSASLEYPLAFIFVIINDVD